MLVEEEFANGYVILRLNGELDLNTADLFRWQAEEALERHRSERLILNLKRVSFIDSTGLGAILGRYRRVVQHAGRMVIVAPPPHVQAVLEMAGIRKIIPILSSEQKALAG